MALLLLALPAYAGDDAPTQWAVMQPYREGPYRVHVHEVAPDDARSWAILRGWMAGPDVPVQTAPVPLPSPGLMMIAALGGLLCACLR